MNNLKQVSFSPGDNVYHSSISEVTQIKISSISYREDGSVNIRCDQTGSILMGSPEEFSFQFDIAVKKHEDMLGDFLIENKVSSLEEYRNKRRQSALKTEA